MKKTLTFTIIVSLLAGFIQFSKGQEVSELQKSEIEKQIHTIFRSMVKEAENLDYDKLSSSVDDRYNAGFITNGAYYTNYDSLVNILKNNTPAGAQQQITVQHEKISVLTENIVLLSAYGVANADISPGRTITIKFLWTFVYEKFENEWKVIQSHQSTKK